MSSKITFRSKQTTNEDSKNIFENTPIKQFGPSEIDILEITRSLVRRLPLITGLLLLVGVLTTAFLFSIPNRYQSTATILPSGKSSNFSALKAVVGLSNFGSSDENSSAIFPVILQSNLVRTALIDKKYEIDTESGKENLTLSEYFEESNPDMLKISLAGITEVSTDKRTGEITISVETIYPTLSQALTFEYIDQLETFNLHKRKSAAKDNESYLASQVNNSGGELRKAEEKLKEFCLSHRDWAISTNPKITTDLARLKRDVELRSTSYLFLQQQYEVARFEAQKDLPIIRLLDSPSLPIMKSGPFRLKILLMVMAVTLFLIITCIIIIDSLRSDTNTITNEISGQLAGDIKEQYPRIHRFYHRFLNKRKNSGSFDRIEELTEV